MSEQAGAVASMRFCPQCAGALAWAEMAEDGGVKSRLRCVQCGWTFWNNPTPVLAAIIEVDGHVLLARNSQWPPKMFALVAGFMEAGESPQDGIAREVREETSLQVQSCTLVGAYGYERLNQLILVYHVAALGEVHLSPELADYRWVAPENLRCWRAGTGPGLADWLRSRGLEPCWLTEDEQRARTQPATYQPETPDKVE